MSQERRASALIEARANARKSVRAISDSLDAARAVLERMPGTAEEKAERTRQGKNIEISLAIQPMFEMRLTQANTDISTAFAELRAQLIRNRASASLLGKAMELAPAALPAESLSSASAKDTSRLASLLLKNLDIEAEDLSKALVDLEQADSKLGMEFTKIRVVQLVEESGEKLGPGETLDSPRILSILTPIAETGALDSLPAFRAQLTAARLLAQRAKKVPVPLQLDRIGQILCMEVTGGVAMCGTSRGLLVRYRVDEPASRITLDSQVVISKGESPVSLEFPTIQDNAAIVSSYDPFTDGIVLATFADRVATRLPIQKPDTPINSMSQDASLLTYLSSNAYVELAKRGFRQTFRFDMEEVLPTLTETHSFKVHRRVNKLLYFSIQDFTTGTGGKLYFVNRSEEKVNVHDTGIVAEMFEINDNFLLTCDNAATTVRLYARTRVPTVFPLIFERKLVGKTPGFPHPDLALTGSRFAFQKSPTEVAVFQVRDGVVFELATIVKRAPNWGVIRFSPSANTLIYTENGPSTYVKNNATFSLESAPVLATLPPPARSGGAAESRTRCRCKRT